MMTQNPHLTSLLLSQHEDKYRNHWGSTVRILISSFNQTDVCFALFWQALVCDSLMDFEIKTAIIITYCYNYLTSVLRLILTRKIPSGFHKKGKKFQRNASNIRSYVVVMVRACVCVCVRARVCVCVTWPWPHTVTCTDELERTSKWATVRRSAPAPSRAVSASTCYPEVVEDVPPRFPAALTFRATTKCCYAPAHHMKHPTRLLRWCPYWEVSWCFSARPVH